MNKNIFLSLFYSSLSNTDPLYIEAKSMTLFGFQSPDSELKAKYFSWCLRKTDYYQKILVSFEVKYAVHDFV